MSTPYLQVGKAYVIKTVTHYYMGTVIHWTPSFVVLKDASEIYETGPLADFFDKGTIKYCECLPDEWCVPTGVITGWGPWPHELPKKARIQ